MKWFYIYFDRSKNHVTILERSTENDNDNVIPSYIFKDNSGDYWYFETMEEAVKVLNKKFKLDVINPQYRNNDLVFANLLK